MSRYDVHSFVSKRFVLVVDVNVDFVALFFEFNFGFCLYVEFIVHFYVAFCLFYFMFFSFRSYVN